MQSPQSRKSMKALSTTHRHAIHLNKRLYTILLLFFLSGYPSPHKCTLGFFFSSDIIFILLHFSPSPRNPFFPSPPHTFGIHINMGFISFPHSETPVAWDYFPPTANTSRSVGLFRWRRGGEANEGWWWKSSFFALPHFSVVLLMISLLCLGLWVHKTATKMFVPFVGFLFCFAFADDEYPWYGFCCCWLKHKREKRINKCISVAISMR